MKRFVISDMDGTILRHQNKTITIDQITIDAINKISKDNNYNFSIATGRHYLDVMQMLENHNIKLSNDAFIVGMNGCQIYSCKENKLIYSSTIENNDISLIDEISEYLYSNFKEVMLFGYGEPNSLFFIKNKKLNDEVLKKKVLEYEGENSVIKIEFHNDISDIKNAFKFCISISTDTDIYEIVKYLEKKYPQFTFYKTGPRYMEILPKGVSKKNAIAYINDKFLKNDPKNMISLGDSGNDIEMLEYTGTSITRFDTDDKVKSVCNKVYEYVASEFVGKAIIDILERKI